MKFMVISISLTFALAAAASPGASDVPLAAFGEKSPTRIFLTGITQAGRPYPVERKIVEVYPYLERCSIQIPYVAGKKLTATFSEGYEVYSTPLFANFGRTYGRGPKMTASTGLRGELVEADLQAAYEPLDTKETIEKRMAYLFKSKVSRMGLDNKKIPQNMTATILLFEYTDDNAVVLKDMTFNVYAAEVSAENVRYAGETFTKDNVRYIVEASAKYDNIKVNLTYAIKGTKISCPNLMSENEINSAVLK